MRRVAAIGLGAMLAAAIAGCAPAEGTLLPGQTTPTVGVSPSPGGTPGNGPPFEAATCPDEVTFVMVVVPACGYLTVPERHARPDGPAIRVFVVRIDPPAGMSSPDAMVVVGHTLGVRLPYGEIVPMAERTGRTVYLVDRRGTGLSEPALECPEVESARPAALAAPTADAAASGPTIAAIRACHDRLAASGIDLAAYGLDESARDIEDLRVALALEPWNVIALGSASRLAFEVARVAPAGVRTVVADSPVVPGGPDPTVNVAAAASSIAALVRACSEDGACESAHPDVSGDLEAVARTLDDRPVTVEVPGDAAGPTTVVIDGVRYARAIRDLLGADGGDGLDEVLASISAAPDATLTPTSVVARQVAAGDGLCLGYVPRCPDIVEGSLLTTVCRDMLPFTDRDAVAAASADLAALSRVFASDPYPAACEAWGIEPAGAGIAAPVHLSIPVLAMTGEFDPFTGPIAEVEAAAPGAGAAIYLPVPRQGYNVFGSQECPRQVRRAWLDMPDAPPDPGCLKDLREVRLLP